MGQRRIMNSLFGLFFLVLPQTILGVTRILEGPKDISTTEGGTAIFKCSFWSPSSARVFWTFNENLVQLTDNARQYTASAEETRDENSQQTQILEDGTLVLRNVARSAAGVYACTVVDEDSLERIVSAPAILNVEDRTEKPRISHRPVKTTVHIGELIVLDCLASGYPPPFYTWYKDGGRLSAAHDRFTLAENGSLIISNAQLDDSARYRCSASNYLGKATSSVKVQVENLDPPSPPQITTRPRNRSVQEGGIIEMTCVAQGSPYPTVTWWNNRRLVTANSRVTLSNGGQHLRIQDIEIYDQGDYSCVAENIHGKEQIVSFIRVQPDPNRREQSQWRFTTTETPRTSRVTPANTIRNKMEVLGATLGSNIQLHCRTEEDGSQVYWEKDGRSLAASPLSRVASDGSMFLYNIKSRDAGEYICKNRVSRENRMIIRMNILPGDLNTSSTSRPAAQLIQAESSTGVPGLLGRNKDSGNQVSYQEDVIFAEKNYHEDREENSVRHETDLSYDVSEAKAGDQFVIISLEEARRTVDKALNSTVNLLFHYQEHTYRTPHQLLNIFRYPSNNDRELARAGEIYHRTLDLVEAKVREGGQYNLTQFTVHQLISPANIELIGNLSGCETIRRHLDCEDVCFHNRYRSADGSCNNWSNPSWGSSLTPFRRVLPPQYENGFNTPIGFDLDKMYNGFKKPGARLVSSKLISTKKVTPDPRLTSMVMQWGQFLDHDLDHSMESVSRETFGTGQTCSGTCENNPPCFPIPVPDNDTRINTHKCIEFTRSSASCGSGTTSVFFEKLQQREQVNQLTAFIDASQVYGNGRTLALNLRNQTNNFGRLREGVAYEHGKPLLPYNDQHPIDCRRDPRESSIGCFLAGDVRANEQLGLISIHTLWFREHNRIVDNLRDLNPFWDGDRLYEEGRKIVWASMQHITFKHWLPLIIGETGMRRLGQYQEYDAGLDPSIANVFASSAFRFGHTMISPVMRRLNSNFSSIPEGDLSLHQAFFSPWRIVEEGGIDPILRGLYHSPAKMPMPEQGMNSDLTEKLFQAAHTVALDLAALNIQRGRDHGIPPYIDWVKYCGLGSINTWEDISTLIKDVDVRNQLKELYGHPGNIDLFVGSIMENLEKDGRVGPTIKCLLIEQFTRLRSADRFWYERPGVFTPDQLAQIKQVNLANIICNNGDDIRRVPKNVFLNSETSDLTTCSQLQHMSFKPWKECPSSSEQESRRHRRDASLEDSLSRAEARIKQLEDDLRQAKNIDEASYVCITESGEMKQSGDSWTLGNINAELICFCQEGLIKCKLAA